MDYFHYKYYCPHLTSTAEDRVCCQHGSRMVAPSVAIARNYVQTYCASEEGWKNCSIAQMINRAYDRRAEIKKEFKKWNQKK